MSSSPPPVLSRTSTTYVSLSCRHPVGPQRQAFPRQRVSHAEGLVRSHGGIWRSSLCHLLGREPRWAQGSHEWAAVQGILQERRALNAFELIATVICISPLFYKHVLLVVLLSPKKQGLNKFASFKGDFASCCPGRVPRGLSLVWASCLEPWPNNHTSMKMNWDGWKEYFFFCDSVLDFF